MRSLSRVELGVSFGACGFVAVAFMVAICCVLWWGRRAISRGLLQVCRKPGRDILLRVLFSGMKKKKKNRASSSSTVDDVDPCQICSSVVITVDQLESTTSEEEDDEDDENWWGLPWVLFTIREETEAEMKALAEEEEKETEEGKSSCTAGRRRGTPLTLADFLDQGGCQENTSPVPKPAASSPAKMKSLMVRGKTYSVPFHPPPVIVDTQAINDSSCNSSSSDEFHGSFLTIVVE